MHRVIVFENTTKHAIEYVIVYVYIFVDWCVTVSRFTRLKIHWIAPIRERDRKSRMVNEKKKKNGLRKIRKEKDGNIKIKLVTLVSFSTG